MNRILTVLALLTVLASLTPNAARAGDGDVDEKLDLLMRFEEGQTLTLKSTTEQNTVMWIGGNEQETDRTIVLGLTFDVKAVDEDGTATIDVSFGPIAIKMQGPEGSFEYDSENPPDELSPPAAQWAAMVECGFTMKMTPKGHVTEISGSDKMLERMSETIEAPDKETRNAIAEEMKRQFGGDALKEMIENVTVMLPEEPVAVGDSWSNEVSLTRAFPAVFVISGTLLERADGVATIEVECTFKPDPDAAPMKMGPASITYKLEGTQQGMLKIDEATGWLIRGGFTQELKGETIITSPDQPGEMSVPITIDSTITLKAE